MNITQNRPAVHRTIRIVLCGIFLLFPAAVRAQNSDAVLKLQLARQYEESDDWEHAAALYQSLYSLQPGNYLFADGLQRSLTHLKEYSSAIRVIRAWLLVHPEDVNMTATLGGLLYDSGNEHAADSVWTAAVASDPRSVPLYRVIANAMMEHSLYDRCIRLYLDGRKAAGDNALFADELGTIYAALQRYREAAREYLLLVEQHPDQLYFAQARLSALSLKPDALKEVSETVREEIGRTPDAPAVHRLYAWLLGENRRFDAALDQYRIIDRLTNANGSELYNFALRLVQEHEPGIAAQAFREIIDGGKNTALLPYVRFGYARSLEELAAEPDTSHSGPSDETAASRMTGFRDAVQVYESLIAQYAIPDLTAQALYRIGVIQCDHLFDLDGALSALNRIETLHAGSTIPFDADLKIGEVQTARNDLAEARRVYRRLLTNPFPGYSEQAAYRIAELDYFEGKFDTALAALKRFDANPNTDLTNDALQLQYFIQENIQTNPAALGEFAAADLLQRQRRYPESLAQFQDILRRNPDAMLVDDGWMKIGALQLRLNHPLDAVAAFRFVADSMKWSILKDRSQFRIAEVYENTLRNKPQAVAEYEKLLAKYPNSLYAEESRKRIRLLRGDIL